MSFLQSCFIRKNTPELRKKLEVLGYIKSEFGSDFNNSIATTAFNVKSFYTCIREQSFDDTNPHSTWGFEFRIDCDDNEELFLALAALRDDDDYMQWFTDGERWYQDKRNDIEVIRYGAGSPINFHKATVEEIIEHFKTK